MLSRKGEDHTVGAGEISSNLIPNNHASPIGPRARIR